MTTNEVAPIIRRYFELAGQPDSEDYFALFDEDAVVEDESTEHRGVTAIREWRRSVPLVSYEITDVEDTPAGTIVTATITGDFPGSPFAGLRYRFSDYDESAIRLLRIAP
ncbi:nuclear transport factor 2 family protein [Micromonospora taraxaci]|uniref:nuclear transport factor 2 family protein n=1 Tax=Micromonospora taraxaci TaxID=1316803 RepID=UPI0033BC8644